MRTRFEASKRACPSTTVHPAMLRRLRSGADDEGLRRRAAGVDARPTEELPLNESHRHAGAC